MGTLNAAVAIVTGAASGIGAATARRLAGEGARVVLSDIQEEPGKALANQIGGCFIRADVTRETEIEALIAATLARHDRLDIMINNAGALGAVGGIGEIDGDDWSRTMAILLDSVFFGMKHAARAIRDGGRGGAILSTASVGGVAALTPHAYAAAKHAVVGLTKSVAAELAPHRIRVNAVAPGQVATALTVAAYGGEDALRTFAMERNPMGTMVEADEIAGAFVYLAGPDGVNVTGQILVVDSGLIECRLPESYYRREG